MSLVQFERLTPTEEITGTLTSYDSHKDVIVCLVVDDSKQFIRTLNKMFKYHWTDHVVMRIKNNDKDNESYTITRNR